MKENFINYCLDLQHINGWSTNYTIQYIENILTLLNIENIQEYLNLYKEETIFNKNRVLYKFPYKCILKIIFYDYYDHTNSTRYNFDDDIMEKYYFKIDINSKQQHIDLWFCNESNGIDETTYINKLNKIFSDNNVSRCTEDSINGDMVIFYIKTTEKNKIIFPD